jgi:predicted nucleotidyltransferase
MPGERAPDRLADRVASLGEVIAAHPGVVFAYLFGSQATGRAGPLSDVDVAVFLDEHTDAFEAKLALADALARHLGTDRVDVVVLNSAPIALAGRVMSTRRVLLDRDPFARHRYESSIIRQFADFLVFERRHLARRHGRG